MFDIKKDTWTVLYTSYLFNLSNMFDIHSKGKGSLLYKDWSFALGSSLS